LSLKGNALSVSIGEAQLYGGRFTGDATLTRFADKFVARTSAKLAEVALRPALGDLAGVQALAGAGSGQVDLSAQGATWAELIAGISGRVTFSVGDGAAAGIDLAQLASLAEPAAEPLGAGSGVLPFTRFTGSATLDAGIVETTDATLTGRTYRIDFKGWGSLASGLIDARATLSPSNDAATGSIPIAISGTWKHPQFDLDRDRIAAPTAVVPPVDRYQR